MRFMTGATAVLALASLQVAPLAAQGKTFEGTVTFHTVADEDVGSFTYSMKGSRARFEPQAVRMPMYMILDMQKEVMLMVMTGENMYMEMPLDNEDSQGDEVKMPDPVNTGKTDVVAGRSCEIWRLNDPEEEKTYEMCLARDMGMFMQGSNPMGGSGAASAAWQAELRKGGLFPLRVVEKSGGASKQVLVATKIEEKKLDDSLFTVPSGMKKMEMPGGMGRRPR